MRPSIGRIVHYVSYGTPGGEYASQCRAAIVAGIPDPEDAPEFVDLVVLNPTGLFFDRCRQDEPLKEDQMRVYYGGTWHWPEQVS